VNGLPATAAGAIWRHRFVLALLVLLVTAAAGLQIPSFSVSNSLESWYPDDDPALTAYREFLETYGSDEIVVVAVESPSALTFDGDEGVRLVGNLTDALLDLDGVATVTSLVTVPESLSAARGRLLSADRKETVLIVQSMVGRGYETRRPVLLEEIRALVRSLGLVPHLGGYGVVFEALNAASTTGAATLIVSSHLVMLAFLTVFFRRAAPVVATIVAIGTATVWTMGLYFGTGHELNMVTMVLPTLVLVIGTADCVHILRSVGAMRATDEKSERISGGLAAVIGPCFVTTVTTAAGFLGLTASGLPIVQQLGWFGAAGVVGAFVSAVVVVVFVLSLAPIYSTPTQSLLDRLARRIFAGALRHPARIVIVYVAASVVAVWGIVELESDTDSIGYLKPSHPVRQDSDFIEREIGPYVPVEFIIEANSSIFDVSSMDAIWTWQGRVVEETSVGWSWSLISALGVDVADKPSQLGAEVIEARRSRIERFSPGTYRAMTASEQQMRVSFGAPTMTAGTLQELIAKITALADFPAQMSLRPTGYSPLYTRIVDETVNSQVRGFGVSIALILVLLGLAMKSLRRVLLAIPANAVPVAFMLGLMGLTGIPLDVASATIASVILGLVVDDSVHLLRRRPGVGLLDAMRVSARESGGTLLMTTLLLAAGFLVLALAEIRSIAWFGALASFALITAILSDLLLLPALAQLIERRKGAV
jgi:predicted RND superfamily exporter protein